MEGLDEDPTCTVQGYLAHKKHPSPEDHHRSLVVGLLYGPTGGLFLISEVPLQAYT